METTLTKLNACLDAAYFGRDTLEVAANLVGAQLTTTVGGLTTTGRIVEAEAYTQYDEASHSFRGVTPRNTAMFGEPGTIYVYRSYGIHLCFNISTESHGTGAAVLIRALQPLSGIEVMQARRGIVDVRQLANGPGKLTVAMGIDMEMNTQLITDSPQIRLDATPLLAGEKVIRSRRIGISKNTEHDWRFSIAGCEWVSRKAGSGTMIREACPASS